MINKVLIEGDVVRSIWGKSKNAGFFVTIKQEKKVSKFTWINYFPLYANKPLADKLANIIAANSNAHLLVEGELKTYHSKKDNEWKTTILVEKILNDPNEVTNGEK